MKKAKSVKGSSKGTAKSAPKNVGEYLEAVPTATRSTFIKLRAAVQSAVPAEAAETISYGIPAFKYRGTLVWFAAFSNHCSLFPTSPIIEAFKKELKGFSISKGTIQFPPGKPLPVALIRKMVKARVSQQENKKRQ
jgi:uncharacterized protein YdhG (YjbR/CyaY superfamily)